jgi:adenylate cyclase class 2
MTSTASPDQATSTPQPARCTLAFLPVELEPLRVSLTELPATQRFSRALVIHRVFDGAVLGQRQTVSVREELTRAVLIPKQIGDAGSAPEPDLIEITSSSVGAAARWLNQWGLREQHYRECYHEEWSIGDLTFHIENWPDLPTLLTIDGPDEAAVRRAARRLNLPDGGLSGTIEDIYAATTGRDITSEATLLFPREMIR